MSINQSVFLHKSRMPTPEAWAEHIRASGFPLALYTDFHVERMSGFLPCTLNGVQTGFEYFWTPLTEAELEDDAREAAGNRDVMVTFVTRSDPRGFLSALLAGAVLTSMTDGVWWHEESNDFFSPAETMSLANDSYQESLLPEPVQAEAPTKPADRIVQSPIPVRIAFRGQSLLMLETSEAEPRRFTVRLNTTSLPAAPDAVITALWERSQGDTIVRSLEIHGVVRSWDVKGVVEGIQATDELNHLLETLGQADASMQGLLAAGKAAIPGLLAIAEDERASSERRKLARVLLGEIQRR